MIDYNNYVWNLCYSIKPDRSWLVGKGFRGLNKIVDNVQLSKYKGFHNAIAAMLRSVEFSYRGGTSQFIRNGGLIKSYTFIPLNEDPEPMDWVFVSLDLVDERLMGG